MAMDKFLTFVWENSINILKLVHRSVVLNTVYIMFDHFTIYNTKHNPPKSSTIWYCTTRFYVSAWVKKICKRTCVS